VAKYEALLAKILGGAADASIGFGELCNFLERLGFEQRVRGSHHIFTKDGIAEILNPATEGTQGEAVSSEAGAGRDREVPIGGSN
jgi:hypothetical protein